MWNLLNCYLSGRHDFGVSCEPGAIFLRCMHCGKRSNGWALNGHQTPIAPAKGHLVEHVVAANVALALPFTPRDVRPLHSA